MRIEYILIELVSTGLGIDKRQFKMNCQDHFDWNDLFRRASQYGILALSIEGLNKMIQTRKLPESITPDQSLMLEWIAQSIASEQLYRVHLKNAIDFSYRIAKRNVECYTLKGFAFCQYYPKPEYREFGDFDCYFGKDYDKVNNLTSEIGGLLDSEDYKHAHINYKGLTIENHKLLIQIRDGRKRKELENYLESLITREGKTYIGNTRLISPCPLFNAIFLVEHAVHHFLFEKITLRFVCDWACLLNKCQDEIEWKEFNYWMDMMGYMHFAGILTCLAVDHLGLKLRNEAIPLERKYADMVLDDIFADNADKNYLASSKHVRRDILFGRYKNLWKYHKIFHRSATVELLYMLKEYLLK